MNESRTFKLRTFCLSSYLEFLPDRLECSWGYFDCEKRNNKKIFPREELSEKISERWGRSSSYKKSFRDAARNLVLSLLLYVLLPAPWNYSAYLFLMLFAFAIYRSFFDYEKKRWTLIYNKTGKIAVSIRAPGRTQEECDEIRRYYTEWIKSGSERKDTDQTAK